MTHYEKKTLYLVFIIGVALYGVSLFIPAWQPFGILTCTIGMFSFSVLLVEHLINKRLPKAPKKQERQPGPPDVHVEQALNIMYGMDDGRRHYEKLPPEQRQKSMFGGKNVL